MVRTAPLSSVKSFGKVVAKNDRFEVWAVRYLAGNRGQRHYRIEFSAVEVLVASPRQIQKVSLPATIQSNLAKIMAHLESQ